MANTLPNLILRPSVQVHGFRGAGIRADHDEFGDEVEEKLADFVHVRVFLRFHLSYGAVLLQVSVKSAVFGRYIAKYN